MNFITKTGHDIDLKLGPLTKLDKRNMATLKKSDYEVIPTNCDVIAFFLIYGIFAAIQKPNSGRILV